METVLVLSNGMLLAIQSSSSEGEKVADYTIFEKPGEMYDGGQYEFDTRLWQEFVIEAAERLLGDMHSELILDGVAVLKTCNEWSFEDLMETLNDI